jgi:hypothetical protein
MSGVARSPGMRQIREMTAAIREHIRAADLAAASELAARRHRHFVALFAHLPDDVEDDVVEELQHTLSEDRVLMEELASLKSRLERELGHVRSSTRSVRAYVETASADSP